MNKYIVILFVSVFVASVSQIILKISAGKKHGSKLKEYLNPYVMIGYGMLFSSTILTIFAFKGLQYKVVPILESVGYFFMLVLSRLILKEKVTKKKMLGNIIIVLGIVVFNL